MALELQMPGQTSAKAWVINSSNNNRGTINQKLLEAENLAVSLKIKVSRSSQVLVYSASKLSEAVNLNSVDRQ